MNLAQMLQQRVTPLSERQTKQQKPKHITERKVSLDDAKRMLRHMRNPITVHQLESVTGVPYSTLHKRLVALLDKGLVREVNPKERPRLWVRT